MATGRANKEGGDPVAVLEELYPQPSQAVPNWTSLASCPVLVQ